MRTETKARTLAPSEVLADEYPYIRHRIAAIERDAYARGLAAGRASPDEGRGSPAEDAAPRDTSLRACGKCGHSVVDCRCSPSPNEKEK